MQSRSFLTPTSAGALVGAAMLWLGVGCNQEPAPTGIALTVVIMALDVEADEFLLRARLEGEDFQETALPLDGRQPGDTETVNILFGAEDGGKSVLIEVLARHTGETTADGRTEVTLIEGSIVSADVVLRSCLAASGPFCDNDELVTCDPVTDKTARTGCAFGCNEDRAACNECNPGAVECLGSTHVVCGADGTAQASEDCATVAAACRTGLCTPDGCVVTGTTDNEPCEDGLFCTVDTVCMAGVCGGGAPRDCSDANACTFDTCDETADTCEGDPLPYDEMPCDDGLFCIVGESCLDGICGGGTSRPCADANPCTQDACDESAGICIHPNELDDTTCDDDRYCTIDDTCIAGVCTGGAQRSCDDGNDCTAESCDDGLGRCVHTDEADGTPCDDHLFCTTGTECGGGACGGGFPRDCNDNNPCTYDTCSEASDDCVRDPIPLDSSPCDDSSFCTTGETCLDSVCGGGSPMSCDDADPCTQDSCDEVNDLCAHPDEADDTPCDDDQFCTVNDECAAGVCTGGGARDCDDNNDCTIDGCNEASNICGHADETDGTLCDDGLFCTDATQCLSGTCGGGVPTDCADTNDCTFDTCDEINNTCDRDPVPMNGAPCSDGLFCTSGETCSNGTCGGSSPKVCDDSNPCTENNCDEGTDQCDFSIFKPDTTPCEDGLYCTSGDTCSGGACQAGAASPCADANPCRDDVCDEANDACSYPCSAAGIRCLNTFQQVSCDGACGFDVTVCAHLCNATREECNECDPGTTTCRADLGLLCNAEVVCDADGLILAPSPTCCASNRCTCDGTSCLEDLCASAVEVAGGGLFSGDTCDDADNIPGDCNPGGMACRAPIAAGAPEEMFRLTLNDFTSSSAFYDVRLDTSGSSLDTTLRVSATCGSETQQVPNALVCSGPPGIAPENACFEGPGPETVVLCGLPEGAYYGAVDSAAGACGAYDLNVTVTSVDIDTAATAGNISRGGVFTGNTCGLTDQLSFPNLKKVSGCAGAGNCDVATDYCPSCAVNAANDCTVGPSSGDSLCSYDGRDGPDAVFYLALDVDSGVDISSAGSRFDTVLYIMETGPDGASPPGPVRICNDDCWADDLDGASHIQTSLAAGLYYVILDGATGCGDFVLTVGVSPSATCPNLSCEVPYESCLSCPDDCRCVNCGDGIVQTSEGEQCDDGATNAGDGCSARCTREDGYVCIGEPSTCQPHCGDGFIDPSTGEECDDDNGWGGDGCSAACTTESGFLCSGAPSVCVEGTSATRCPGLLIPDGGPLVTDTINIAAAFPIGDVTVDVDISHTWISDLTIDLISPDNTTLTLHDRSGGSADDIVGNYDLTILPDDLATMDVFNDGPSNGNWRLSLEDATTPDDGILNCWTVNISRAPECPNAICEPPSENCSNCGDCTCPNCNNGLVNRNEGEECDDGGNASGDGCDEDCAIEPGYACSGAPSVCRSLLAYSSCPGVGIPDDDPAGITDVITVPGSCTIYDITIDLDVTHSWIGDLMIEVTSPDGTTVRLHDETGGSDEDIHGNYDLSLTPDGPGSMTDFDGESGDGDWTLFAADILVYLSGTLDCWGVNIICQ